MKFSQLQVGTMFKQGTFLPDTFIKLNTYSEYNSSNAYNLVGSFLVHFDKDEVVIPNEQSDLYSGWSNWETWETFNHLSTEEHLPDIVRFLQKYKNDNQIADAIKYMIELDMPKIGTGIKDKGELFKSLLWQSLSKVNWLEIVKAFQGL